jgi:DNA-binding GntR family transcriptional regulator
LSTGVATPDQFNKITAQIEKNFLNGTYKSGDILSEKTLSLSLGVSRGSLRESLNYLGEIGLINQQPKRGTYVGYFSTEQKNEAISIRVQLESLSIQRLSTIYNNVDSGEQNKISERIEKHLEGMLISAKDNDIPSFFESDLEFHCEIATLAGCDRIAKIIRPQYLTIFLCTQKDFLTIKTAEEMLRSMKDPIINEHQQIWDFIRSNQPGEAIDLLERHLHTAEDKWRNAYLKLQLTPWSRV